MTIGHNNIRCNISFHIIINYIIIAGTMHRNGINSTGISNSNHIIRDCIIAGV